MKPSRVVIVTYNWPPRNAIGAHRPYSWAKYWSGLGRHVTVLTARKYEIDQPLDLVLPELDGVQVIEVPYWPESSTAPVSGGGGKQRRVGLLRWLKATAASRLGLRIDIRDRWIRAAAAVAARLASEADAVVSTYGPRSSHLIASEMKRINPEIRWVADYRDLWSQNHLSALSPRARAKERARELETVGRYADAVTTVSDELATELQVLLDKQVGVVENGFDLSEPELRRNLESWRSGRPGRPVNIVYTGMIYPGRRDPTPLFEAVSLMASDGELSPAALRIHFYGSRNDGVEQMALRSGVEAFVEVHGHVPRQQALQAQADASLTLLLESGAADADGVLTGKLFEYLAAGAPVLSLGSSPSSAIAKVLEYCRSGVCVGNDVGRIRDVLRAALSGEELSWFHPVPERIMEYSREHTATHMLATYLDAVP